MVYAREVQQRAITFGVSGKLLMNGLVMYDHQTDSLWSQVLGKGISGPLEGVPLTHLAAIQTTWDSWASEHPSTLVLDKVGYHLYSSDPYASYYTGGSVGVFSEARPDPRLDAKEFVLGVTVEGATKAYPFSELTRTPVVNDVVGGRQVVVVFDAETATGVVFDRMVDGQVLRFRAAGRREGGRAFRDLETGTTWSWLSGTALEGPWKGRRLILVPSHYAFWFAWSDLHPDSALYGGGR